MTLERSPRDREGRGAGVEIPWSKGVLWAHPIFFSKKQLRFMYMQALNQGYTTFIRPSIAMVEGDSVGLLCEGHF
jgi:hypothetical protein